VAAVIGEATRFSQVENQGASYSMSATSGVGNTPRDVGSGIALANYDDPMIVRCVENVIALSTVGV
jgi:hypothetical protein